MSGTSAMYDTVLRLDANEGRQALSPEALGVLASRLEAWRYPESSRLEEALAESLGVDRERLVATAGADDALDRAARALAGPGGRILSTAPAFEEYAAAAGRSGATYLEVARPLGSALPLEAILKKAAETRPELIIVASPDNPGGGAVTRPELEALAGAGPLVLLDATYGAFAEDQGLVRHAFTLPRLVVAGSFSKSHGLAGFRSGWAVASPATAQVLRQAAPPYALSSPAIAATLAVLALGPEAIAPFVAEVGRERSILRDRLAALGARTWKSEANFVAVLVADAPLLAADLAARGVLVRYWKDRPGRENLIRITCPGQEAAFLRLLEALDGARGLA